MSLSERDLTIYFSICGVERSSLVCLLFSLLTYLGYPSTALSKRCTDLSFSLLVCLELYTLHVYRS